MHFWSFFVLRQTQNTIVLPMTLFVKLHFGETMRSQTGIAIIPMSELGPQECENASEIFLSAD